MSFQKSHNNYSNGSCIHKRSCRYILQGLIGTRRILSPFNSITLPANEFELERWMLMDNPWCNLNMFEINSQVYKEQIKHSIFQKYLNTHERINLYNEDVFSFNTGMPINFIWLDLCNYLTESLFTKLINFLNNTALMEHGVFAITLLSSRENCEAKKFFSRIQRQYLGTYLTTLQNFRNVQFPKILEKVLNEHTHRNCKLVANYSYKPTSGGGTMTMYAYNWSRK